MKAGNIDELFTEEDDPLWTEPTKPKAGKAKRGRVIGPFYHCPQVWADMASEVCGQYLILALRLYRHWKKRAPGTDVIAVTAYALAGPGHSRRGRLRIMARLEEAGLIEVVERAPGRAPRVRVVDDQPNPHQGWPV